MSFQIQRTSRRGWQVVKILDMYTPNRDEARKQFTEFMEEVNRGPRRFKHGYQLVECSRLALVDDPIWTQS